MFYVDDNFASSDPVMKMPRSRRAAAVGLWTLAGTWSARFLKDGFVPSHMVEEFGTLDDAALLVEVKLWRRRRDGFLFVDWARWQRTREQVEAFRKAERDRKAEYRAKKAGKSGEGPGAVPPGQVRDSDTPSPHPSPTTDDDGQSQQQLASGYPQAGDGPVQKARTNPTGTDLGAIVAALRELVPDQPGTLEVEARLVAEHFLEKGGHRVKYPTRYVLASIADDPNRTANFIHTGRWSE